MRDTSKQAWQPWVLRLVAVVLILAAGFGIASLLKKTAPEAESEAPTVSLPQVKVFAAQQVELRRQWNGFGTARALESADVPARVTALVKKKSPTLLPGTAVSTTTTLVELDDSDFQKQLAIVNERIADLNAQLAALDIEEARQKERVALDEKELVIATNEFMRVEEVYKNVAGNPRELDVAKQGVLRAERALLQSKEMLDQFAPRRLSWQAAMNAQERQKELAELNVQRCTIKSPIDGIIQSIDVEEGENIAAGQRVARVVNLSKVEVAVQLPAAARTEVIVGSHVELFSSNADTMLCKAKVSRLSPEDDLTTRTMTVYVEVDQSDRAKQPNAAADPQFITPGQFLSAVAQSSTAETRWVVPRRSIRTGRVLVVSDDVVRARPVTIDYLAEQDLPQFKLPDRQWAVLVNNSQPLSDGEKVIVNASIAVRDGDKVQPVLPGETPAPVKPESASKTSGEPEARRAQP